MPTCSPTLPIWDDVVRCSLAFGCKARFKRVVKREAALVEERSEPPCLTRNPTSATLTPQMMRKRTPITICSFLFPMEGNRSVRSEPRCGESCYGWLTPLAPLLFPTPGSTVHLWRAASRRNGHGRSCSSKTHYHDVHFRDGGDSLKSPAATSWHVTAITTFGGGRA